MALQLQIEIAAETREAESKLRILDDGITQLTRDASKGKVSWQEYEQQLKEMSQAAASAEARVKELSAQKRQLEQQAKNTASATNSLVSSIGAFVTGAAIVSAVKGTADWADKLNDLAAKSGIGAEMLQKLEGAAVDSGISLEKLVSATQMLSDRLASGDKSALSALRSLGIQFDEIRRMSPDQAFLTVAKAVGEIADPMRRAQVATDLFGRSGRELTGILNKDYVDAVNKASGVSEEGVKSLGDMNDAFGQLYRAGRALLSEVLLPFVPALKALADGAKEAASSFSGLSSKTYGGGGTLAFGNFFGIPPELMQRMFDKTWLDRATGADLPKATGGASTASSVGAVGAMGSLTPDQALSTLTALNDQNDALRGSAAEHKRLAAAARKAAAVEEAYADALHKTALYQFNQDANFGRFLNSGGWRNGAPALTPAVDLGGGAGDIGWSGLLQTQTGAMGYGGYTGWQRNPNAFSWGGSNGFTATALNSIMPMLAGSLGGGGRSGAIGGSIGGLLGTMGAQTIISAVGQTALSAVLPGIGTALGAIVGPLLGKLFGPSQGKLAAQDRAAFIQQAGGAEGFNDIFRNAQIAPDLAASLTNRFMSAQTPEAVKAAIDAINAAVSRNNDLLKEQAGTNDQITSLTQQRKQLEESLIPTYDDIVKVTEKYGINLDAAGSKVQQLGATKTFTDLLNDMQMLERAGFDTGTMLDGMADDISKVVQRSQKFGTEIPSNMRPYLQSLSDAGRLLDAQGNNITDLSTLKWGDPVKTQADIVRDAMDKIAQAMEPLTARLKEIVDLLANRIPRAASDAADAVSTVNLPGGGEGRGDIPAMASGGIVTRPTLALIGERGPEAVLPLSRLKQMSQRIVLEVDRRVLGEVTLGFMNDQLRAVSR